MIRPPIFITQLICTCLLGLIATTTLAAPNWWPWQKELIDQKTEVIEPYVNVYTGPSRGFPIDEILERGDIIIFHKSQTDWFLVETPSGHMGWIAMGDMPQTFRPQFIDTNENNENYFDNLQESYFDQRWYFGFYGGALAHASTMGAKFGFRLNDYFSTEFAWNEATGDVTDRTIYNLALVWHPFELYNLEPYFLMGGGKVKEQPNQSEISPTTIITGTSPFDTSLESDADEAIVGGGITYPLSRRFSLQATFKNHFMFVDGEKMRSLQEWNLGFSFYLGSEANYLFTELFDRRIESDDFEFGFYTGSYSIEDFGANTTSGLIANYHVSESYFIASSYASTKISDKSYRERGLSVLDTQEGSSKATLEYYTVALGFNILPGEVVFSRDNGWVTNLYAISGVGNTKFQNQDLFTVILGFGVKIKPKDDISVHFGFRNHVYELKLLGQEKITNNFETRFGLTWSF